MPPTRNEVDSRDPNQVDLRPDHGGLRTRNQVDSRSAHVPRDPNQVDLRPDHGGRAAVVFLLSAMVCVAPARAAGPERAGEKEGGGTRSIVGHIVDSTCLAQGEQPSADHTACAVRCIRRGAPIAIVEEKTGQVFIAVPRRGKTLNEILLPLVGRRTEVTGTVVRTGGAQLLVVEKAAGEHEHASKQGGVVAMAGDLHLETLALRSGEVRVYLSDAFRKPVSLAGRKGSVEVRVEGEPIRSAALTPEANGHFLAASVGTLSSAEVEVTVRLPVEQDPAYFITFMLEPRDAAAGGSAGHGGAGSAGKGEVAAKVGAGVAAGAVAGRGRGSEAAPGAQEVVITVDGDYSPKRVVLKKGVPARLRFVRKESGACAGEVVIPSFGVRQTLAPLAETVVAFTPDKKGEFPFTCGMHMMEGKLVVTP